MPPVPASLAELLGTAPPPAVQTLPPAAQERLAEIIADARAQQRRTLDAAFEAALRHLPVPLRPLARRMLLG
jgi:hypothetical protein